jgi:hypothetical protein
MNEEKQIVLNRIDELISKRTAALMEEMPDVHEVDDGIIIRFFTEWDNCEDDEEIKFKKVVNEHDPNEINVFFYLPKGSYFELKKRFFIACMTCLNGKMEVSVNGDMTVLESYSKICPNSDEVVGKALENTYLVTTSNRLAWSEETHEHVKQFQ